MAKKILGLANFKKVHEDQNSATLRHPDGHEIKIAKSILSPQHAKQLQGLPLHAANGAQIQPDDGGGVDYEPVNEGQQVASNTTAPQAQSMQPSVVQTQEGAQPGLGGGDPEQYRNEINKNVAGMQEEATAKGQAGTNEANIYQQQAAASERFAQDMGKYMNKADDEAAAFQRDIDNQHIDPDHYIKNMSAGSKIATALGLIIGGMGAGITHSANPAEEFLNNAINHDIESQKAEIGKKQSLYSANLEHFKNHFEAQKMTQAMYGQMFAAKLGAEAARSTNPLEQARLKQLQSKFMMDYALPKVQEITNRRQMLAAASQGKIDPAQTVPFLVPKEQQKEVYKEIEKAQSAAQNGDKILSLYDQAIKENTVMRTGAGWLRTPQSIQGIHAMALPMIHDAEGRVNEFELKTIDDLLPKPGNSEAKNAANRANLEAFINQKKQAPTAKAYGIDIQNFNSTSSDSAKRLPPEQQQYVAWAKANPGNPKAAAVLQKLGIK